MEKKKYIAPKITVIEVEPQSILQASIGVADGNPDESEMSDNYYWGD